MFEEIDKNVLDMVNGKEVKYRAHYGGCYYVSVTTGLDCVDFRLWYLPYGREEVKPTKKGIALRLREWAEIRRTMKTINRDYPSLASEVPCYMNTDHNNQQGYFECRECQPFCDYVF